MTPPVWGTYRRGAVILHEPVDWPEEAAVQVALDVVPQDLALSQERTWPESEGEIEKWCQEIEAMAPVFDDCEELAAFEKRLADSKEEQKKLTRQSWQTPEDLFE